MTVFQLPLYIRAYTFKHDGVYICELTGHHLRGLLLVMCPAPRHRNKRIIFSWTLGEKHRLFGPKMRNLSLKQIHLNMLPAKCWKLCPPSTCTAPCNKVWQWNPTICKLQPSAVMTRCTITWYCTRCCRNWGKLSIRVWTHKIHPIAGPDERAIGCIF